MIILLAHYSVHLSNTYYIFNQVYICFFPLMGSTCVFVLPSVGTKALEKLLLGNINIFSIKDQHFHFSALTTTL